LAEQIDQILVGPGPHDVHGESWEIKARCDSTALRPRIRLAGEAAASLSSRHQG
jgi:hypothetical protein